MAGGDLGEVSNAILGGQAEARTEVMLATGLVSASIIANAEVMGERRPGEGREQRCQGALLVRPHAPNPQEAVPKPCQLPIFYLVGAWGEWLNAFVPTQFPIHCANLNLGSQTTLLLCRPPCPPD